MVAFDFRGFLAIIIVGALIVLAFALLFQPAPEGNAELQRFTIGSLIAGFNCAIAYYFGSGRR